MTVVATLMTIPVIYLWVYSAKSLIYLYKTTK